MRMTVLICSVFAMAIGFAYFRGDILVAGDRPQPMQRPTSSENIEATVKDALKFAVAIRSTSGNNDLTVGDISHEDPAYNLFTVKGTEQFVGKPMQIGDDFDEKLPCEIYYKVKYDSLINDVVHVTLTVGQALNVERKDGVAAWNEQIWTVTRDLRLGEICEVQLTAPNNKAASDFAVRLKVAKFDGKLN